MNRQERIEQEATSPYYPTCDVCGLTFTEDEWDDRHTGHEPGCPFANTEKDELEESYTDLEEIIEYALGCECNLNYHSHCCPDCEHDMGEYGNGNQYA